MLQGATQLVESWPGTPSSRWLDAKAVSWRSVAKVCVCERLRLQQRSAQNVCLSRRMRPCLKQWVCQHYARLGFGPTEAQSACMLPHAIQEDPDC